MTPDEHYEHAERLAGNSASSDLPTRELMFTVGLAQVHATLALAGYTRDATAGHVHQISTDHGAAGVQVKTTSKGRLA